VFLEDFESNSLQMVAEKPILDASAPSSAAGCLRYCMVRPASAQLVPMVSAVVAAVVALLEPLAAVVALLEPLVLAVVALLEPLEQRCLWTQHLVSLGLRSQRLGCRTPP
jgi:hypothetical protein